MKTKTFFILAFLAIFSSTVNSQSEKWHYYNYASDGQCVIASYVDMAFDNSGNTYAVGHLLQPANIGCFRQPNVVVHKFNNLGVITATYEYDYESLEENDFAISIRREGSTGKIFVLAQSHQFSVLIKLSASLVFQNEKRFYDVDPKGFEVGFGSVFIAGNSNDGVVSLRYKTSNCVLTGYNLYEGAVVSDCGITNKGFVTTGYIGTPSSGNALFVENFDSLLNPLWTKTNNRFPGNNDDRGIKVEAVNDNIYVGGSCQDGVNTGTGIIIKYNSAGTKLWNQLLPFSSMAGDYASFTDLSVDLQSQHVYVLGTKSGTDRVYRYSTNGIKLIDTAVVISGTISTTFKSISNNSTSGLNATILFLAGTNSYIGAGGAYERCVTHWLDRNTGGMIYNDYDAGTGATFDPSFSFTYGKVNTKVSPFEYVTVGTGRTEVSNPQASGSVGFIDCYNLPVSFSKSYISNGNNKVQIYPDPASDEIIIQSETGYDFFKITDLDGKLLYTGKSGGVETRINIHDLVPGVYIMELNSGTDIFYKKFIKSGY